MLGSESIRVELRHTGSSRYWVGAEVREFYPHTGQIALNPPKHWGTGISYTTKPNCDDSSSIQEISKSCTDITVNPPFPLRLDTDLPVRLYYDFKPDRQPVLAEMLSDAQRKAYSAEGSSIRLLVDNRYYEDTEVNRLLLLILILCYCILVFSLVGRWITEMFRKPRAVRGLVGKPEENGQVVTCPFEIEEFSQRYCLVNEERYPVLLYKNNAHVHTFNEKTHHDLELADLGYLVNHQSDLVFHVCGQHEQERNYKLKWYRCDNVARTKEVSCPNVPAPIQTRYWEIFDPNEYVTFDSSEKFFLLKLFFLGPFILFVALVRFSAELLSLRRLIYPPHYFRSQFESTSEFTPFDYIKVVWATCLRRCLSTVVLVPLRWNRRSGKVCGLCGPVAGVNRVCDGVYDGTVTRLSAAIGLASEFILGRQLPVDLGILAWREPWRSAF
jgi:hypothetical protein